MEKIELKRVDKTIYKEILENGLEVIVIPNEKFSKKKNYYFNYGTYYGSIYNSFIPYNDNKFKQYPHGIAHFLEHKMFEVNENQERPFDFYAKSGSYVNAFTSYKSTCYIVAGNKKKEENLEFLLNFVNNPYFTDENVLKEQGIILEEAAMNDDNPDYLALKTLNNNLYHNSFYKIPILGTKESIKKITKEDLYECYNTFYQPDNMFLVIGGAVDPYEMISLVNKTLKKYPSKNSKRQINKVVEKINVVKEYEEINKNIQVEKLALGYKMSKSNFKIKNKVILDLYLNMFISLCFGTTSIFKEMIRKKHLVSRSGYYFQQADNIITFMIEADALNSEGYIKELDNYLKNLEVKAEDFERLKKVWISSEVIKTDYADSLVDTIVDDLVNYNEVITDYVDLIKAMNINTMNEVIKSFDFSNRAIVKII